MLSINGKKVSISAVKTDCNLTPLTVKKSGTYFPEESDGFNKVVVEVEAEEKESVVLKPLTVTQNGPYEGGIEDGKQVGYNPVTVNVPLPVSPLTVTENGTYTAKEGEGFNKVVVDVKFDKSTVIKTIIDARRTASYIFHNATTLSNEYFAELVREDTFESALSLLYGFHACIKLEELPMITMPNCQNLSYAFYDCGRLRRVSLGDLRFCNYYDYSFHYCYALEELLIKNIQADIQVGNGTSWGHLLKLECAIRLLYECLNSHFAKTITFSRETGKLLDKVYVKSIAITDEMRAEDDLVDRKLPFVVCEPTDEGATLITEYVLQKNWQVAYA